MKKVILFSTTMLLSFFALAQKEKESNSSITLGVKGGLSFAKFSLSGNTASRYTISSLTSFYVGGVVDIPLFSVFSVQPGLLIIGKGSDNQLPFASPVSIDTKFSPFYLEIPINLMTKRELGPGTFFVGAGPYVSFGIGGKVKRTFTDLSGVAQVEKDTNIQFGSNTSNDLKRTDFGFNILLGYQLKNGANIHGGYSFSLTDIDPDNTSSTSFKNSVISIGLGYFF